MSKTEVLQCEVKRFLSTTSPEVLCISGDWGVGKTFTWQKILDDAVESDKVGVKKYSYVSLFGISSLDGLKMAIFENTHSFVEESPDNLKEIGRTYGDVFNGWFRRNRQMAEGLPWVGGAFAKAGPLYFSTVKDQLICIDDLERRSASLTVKEILGLVSFLKEQRRCKIILLLNSKELGTSGADDFNEYAEKVIDVELQFVPSPEESARIALSNSDIVGKLLGECCVFLGISNIRVIKKIERFIREAEPHLGSFDQKILDRTVKTLTLLGWSKFQPKAAPRLEFIKNRTSKDFFGLDFNEEGGETEEEKKWRPILNEYGFRWMGDFDYLLLDSLEVGYFNPEELKSSASLLQQQIVADQDNMSFQEAWDMFHDSFENNEEAVLENIIESFKRSVKTITPTNLNGTVSLFREVGRDDVADILIKYYVDFRNDDSDFWDLEEYAFSGDVKDEAIKEAFSEKLASFKKPFDPLATLIKIGPKDDYDSDDIDGLASVSSEEYYSLFKSEKGAELRRIVRAALRFRDMKSASDKMRSISCNAEEALRRIGAESPLNMRRIIKYGVSLKGGDVPFAKSSSK